MVRYASGVLGWNDVVDGVVGAFEFFVTYNTMRFEYLLG